MSSSRGRQGRAGVAQEAGGLCEASWTVPGKRRAEHTSNSMSWQRPRIVMRSTQSKERQWQWSHRPCPANSIKTQRRNVRRAVCVACGWMMRVRSCGSCLVAIPVPIRKELALFTSGNQDHGFFLSSSFFDVVVIGRHPKSRRIQRSLEEADSSWLECWVIGDRSHSP